MLLPPQWKDVIEVLNAHGINFRRLTKPLKTEVESYRFSDVKFATASFENRVTVISNRIRLQRHANFLSGQS
jgi:hypothetical protein